MFGNLGLSESIMIFAVALVVLGPRRLPKIAASLGKAVAQFRRQAMELRQTVEQEIEVRDFQEALSPLREASSELRDRLNDALPRTPRDAPSSSPPSPAPAASADDEPAAPARTEPS